MKRNLLLLLTLSLSLTVSSTFAKIWRLNNNPGNVNADFTALQTAHNAAAAGDTLYLEGSPNTYGQLESSKKLVIMGPGYYLAENSIANINTASALVSYIYMNNGSQGSEITGLDFNGNGIIVQTSDIIIKRNKFNSSNGVDNPIWTSGPVSINNPEANNIFIMQNYGLQIQGSNYPNTGILITNNLISSNFYSVDTDVNMNLHPFTMAVVQNNIFLRGTVTAHRASFTNNIMVNGFFEKRENMTANNIGNGTQFGTTDGNKANIDMSTVFVGTGSPDARWKLKVGSPAIGAGYGSTSAKPVDAGMFWGNTPYKLSGLPGIPVIYFINVQTVGSNTDPIDVTVKVKSTN